VQRSNGRSRYRARVLSSTRRAWFVILLWASSVPALAQERTAPANGAPSRSTRIVFVLPELDADGDAQLRDALLAQFALVEADLTFAAPRSLGSTLAERLQALAALADQSQALAAFWLDVEPNGRWLLHVLDAERQRLVVRPLDAAGDLRSSAIEAVAVMTRESTRALAEGTPLPEIVPPAAPVQVPTAEPAPAPEATPAPAPEPAPATEPAPQVTTAAAPPEGPPTTSGSPSPPLGPLRLWVGYVGTTFGSDQGVLHGAEVGGGLRVVDGLRFSLGVDLTQSAQHTAAPEFEVQRIPVRTVGSLRVAHGSNLSLELEAAVTFEWLLRTTSAQQVTTPTLRLVPSLGTTDLLVALGPRIHGELRLAPRLALYATLGIDVLLNKFNYIDVRNGIDEKLLELHVVRPVLGVGMALTP